MSQCFLFLFLFIYFSSLGSKLFQFLKMHCYRDSKGTECWKGSGQQSRCSGTWMVSLSPRTEMMDLGILQFCHTSTCPRWTWAEPTGGLETLVWACVRTFLKLSSFRPEFEPAKLSLLPWDRRLCCGHLWTYFFSPAGTKSPQTLSKAQAFRFGRGEVCPHE